MERATSTRGYGSETTTRPTGDDYRDSGLTVPFYINSGDHDEFAIAYHAAVLYETLRQHQPDAVELRIVDGAHNWEVWRSTLPDTLTFLLSHYQP